MTSGTPMVNHTVRWSQGLWQKLLQRQYLCCVSDGMKFNHKAVIQALTYLSHEQKPQVIVMSFGCRPLTANEKPEDDEKVRYKFEERD